MGTGSEEMLTRQEQVVMGTGSGEVLTRQEQVVMGTGSGEMLTRQEQVEMGTGLEEMLTRQEQVVMGTGSGEMLRLQIKTYILKWKCHKSSQNSSLAIAKECSMSNPITCSSGSGWPGTLCANIVSLGG